MSARQQITITWEGPEGRILVGITHTKDHAFGNDRIEVRSLSPKNAALPITQSGYLSHIISAKELAKAGGPRRYVERLLRDGVKSPAWKRYLACLSQPDLFHGADAAALPARPRPQPGRPAKAERGQSRPRERPSPS